MALRRHAFAQLALIVALSESVEARSLICAMSERTNSYYIAPEISLSLLEYDEVSVSDSIVAKAGKKFVLGKVTRETAERLSIIWEVRNVPTDPAEFRRYKSMLQMRLTLQKSDGAATMTVNDILYNRFSYQAAGICRFLD